MGSRFDAYLRRRHAAAKRLWIAAIVVYLAAGFAVGQATSVLLGGVVAVGLLALTELVWARVAKALWLKHFPELRDPHITWRGGWLLGKWASPSRPNRSKHP